MIAIAPSILAADFSRLGELVYQVEQGGADRVHVDVMDGHFVPNLSMGPIVVQGLRPITRLPLEVHLMVEQPAKFVESFRKAGADTLIVHHEVLPDATPLLRHIRSLGAKAGFAINPATPVEVVVPYLEHIDLALCMTVVPGFGGQAYLPQSPQRIARLRQLIREAGVNIDLEVDGGIDLKTGLESVRCGANVLVAGTSIFGSPLGAQAATRQFVETMAHT